MTSVPHIVGIAALRRYAYLPAVLPVPDFGVVRDDVGEQGSERAHVVRQDYIWSELVGDDSVRLGPKLRPQKQIALGQKIPLVFGCQCLGTVCVSWHGARIW
jgi:hypothetical protein